MSLSAVVLPSPTEGSTESILEGTTIYDSGTAVDAKIAELANITISGDAQITGTLSNAANSSRIDDIKENAKIGTLRSTAGNSITKISGGQIDNLYFNGLEFKSIEGSAVIGTLTNEYIIDSIAGNAQITKLINEDSDANNKNSEIKSIGGNANITTLENAGAVTIADNAVIGTMTNKNTNTNNAAKITGGAITQLDNSGTITDISGGTISTLNSNSGSVGISGGSITTLNYTGGTLVFKNTTKVIETLNNKGEFALASAATVGAFSNESTAKTTISGFKFTTNSFANLGNLMFSMSANEMGQLIVNDYFNNNGGTVTVDVAGLTESKQIIVTKNNDFSKITGLTSVVFQNQDSTKTYEYKDGWINVTSTTTQPTFVDIATGQSEVDFDNKSGYKVSVTGGSVTGTLTNRSGGEVVEISSGSVNGLTNESGGKVTAISGGTITTLDNSGTINDISNGTITTLNQKAGASLNISANTAKIMELNNESSDLILSNGAIKNLNNKSGATIADINGNTIVTKLTNEQGGTVTKLSGGVFNIIKNYGKMGDVSIKMAVKDAAEAKDGINFADGSNTSLNAAKFSNYEGGSIEKLNLNMILTTSGAKYKHIVLDNNYGGTIGEITGGTYFNVYNGGNIDIISGGTFGKSFNYSMSTAGFFYNGGTNSTNPDAATIGKITGGTFNVDFENRKNTKIGEISGSANFKKAINNAGTIGNINGGTITTLTNKSGGVISKITSGTITTLDNQKGGTITELAGGSFTNDIKNAGEISKISGNIQKNIANTGTIAEVASGASVLKITNNDAAATATIKGGTVSTLENKSGAVSLESGEITALTNSNAANKVNIKGGKVVTLENTNGTATIESGEVGTLNFTAGTLGITSTSAKIGTLNTKAVLASLENKGTIDKIQGSGITTLTNSGTIGDITNVSVTTLTNNSGGVVDISGTLNGKIVNSGTVNFTMKTANTLGKLVGTFENKDGGRVGVDVQGATLAQKYTFIDGSQTGLIEAAFEIKNPNAEYLKLTLDNDFTSVTLTKSDEFEKDFGGDSGGGQSSSSGTSQISNRYALASKLLTSNADIANTSAVSDADSSIKESYVSNPKAILSSFKAGAAAATPLGMGTISAGIAPNGYKADLMSKAFNKKSKLLASTDLVMTDGLEPLNPFEDESLTELFVTPFGGGLTGNGVSGFMAGLNLGLVKATNDYAIQGVLSYAYGDTKQDLNTQNTDTAGHIFGVGFVAQFYLENLIGASMVEADIHANFTLGKFSLENAWLADSTLNSSSDFTNYQGNIGAQIGPRYSYLNDKLSTKIFVGLQNYYESQGSFSVLDLKSDSYNDYTLNGVAGLEERIMLGESAFIFGRAGYEFRLYNSTKEVFMRDATNELKYENASNKGILTANIGGQIHAADSLKLGIEGIYKHYNTGLNYFGGSVNVRFVF